MTRGFKNTETCRYELTELPEGVILKTGENWRDNSVVKWSGSYPIPQIGERVITTVNGMGSGVVESYFVEHGYLGVLMVLDNPPTWHVNQHKGTKHEGIAMVFGAELKRKEVTACPTT